MAAFFSNGSTLYDVLHANEDATVVEINAAFKRRALEVHHDKGGSKDRLVGIPVLCLADVERVISIL